MMRATDAYRLLKLMGITVAKMHALERLEQECEARNLMIGWVPASKEWVVMNGDYEIVVKVKG